MVCRTTCCRRTGEGQDDRDGADAGWRPVRFGGVRASDLLRPDAVDDLSPGAQLAQRLAGRRIRPLAELLELLVVEAKSARVAQSVLVVGSLPPVRRGSALSHPLGLQPDTGDAGEPRGGGGRRVQLLRVLSTDARGFRRLVAGAPRDRQCRRGVSRRSDLRLPALHHGPVAGASQPGLRGLPAARAVLPAALAPVVAHPGRPRLRRMLRIERALQLAPGHPGLPGGGAGNHPVGLEGAAIRGKHHAGLRSGRPCRRCGRGAADAALRAAGRVHRNQRLRQVASRARRRPHLLADAFLRQSRRRPNRVGTLRSPPLCRGRVRLLSGLHSPGSCGGRRPCEFSPGPGLACIVRRGAGAGGRKSAHLGRRRAREHRPAVRTRARVAGRQAPSSRPPLHGAGGIGIGRARRLRRRVRAEGVASRLAPLRIAGSGSRAADRV